MTNADERPRVSNNDPRAVGRRVTLTVLSGLVLGASFGAPLGCDGQLGPEFSLSAVISEVVPTVASFTWTVDLDGVTSSAIEFGLDEGYGARLDTRVDDSGGYSATAIGLDPTTEYHYRATATADGTTYYSDDQTLTTGAIPSTLPEVSLTEDDGAAREDFLVTSMLTVPTVAAIVDRQGNYRWWYTSSGEREDWPITRARVARDGRSILFLHNVPLSGEVPPGLQEIVRVSLDGESVETIPTPGAHNDFYEHEDGTITILAEDRRDVESEEVTGDQLIEISPDGSETVIWTVWDHLEYEPGTSEYGHWTHANAIDYDPEEGVYHVGARHISTIFKIDRASGDVLWMLGGPESDFELEGGGTEFSTLQHQFEILDDGIVIFDNRDADDPSRAVEYALDETTGVASPRWEHMSDPPFFCYGMGDVDRLDSGDSLITWSTAGVVDEVSPDGEVLWRVQLNLGAGLGYLTVVDTLPGMGE